MCTDFGPDRLRFAGLTPERVKKVNTILILAYNKRTVLAARIDRNI